MKLHYEEIKVGDTSGLLRYRVLFEGEPITIHETTVVTFRMVDRDTGAVIVDDLPGVIVDGDEGIVGYQRQPADVDTERVGVCEYTLDFPSTERHVSPDIILPIIADR